MDYEREMKYYSTYVNTIDFAREEGEARGEAKGEARVLDLVAKGYSLERIKSILKKKKRSFNRNLI